MDEQKITTSEFAIASLVMGIISFVHIFNMEKPIVAVVFGILALKRVGMSPQWKGKNLAIAGIVLGVISVILTIALTCYFWPQIQQMMQKTASPK